MKLIRKDELAELLRDRWKLRCLEMAGVDNSLEGKYEVHKSYRHSDEYTNDELTKDYNEAN